MQKRYFPAEFAVLFACLLCLIGIIVLTLIVDKDSLGIRQDIMWDRLPRCVAALVVGGGLALAALLLQTCTKNPLAEPGLLGINAGGVLGLTLGISFFHIESFIGYMAWSGVGCFIATLLVLLIASVSRQHSPPHFILVGIALSACLGGIANFILLSIDAALDRFRFWNLGSLSGIDTETVVHAVPYFLIAFGGVILSLRWLALMQLEDSHAEAMGLPAKVAQPVIWVVAALFTATAVALAGPILFAGFLAAYLARLLIGSNLYWQILGVTLVGMILVAASDLVAQIALYPFEVPVGVIIALIGSPLTIIAMKNRKFQLTVLEERLE